MAMPAPVQAYDNESGIETGILRDIWETPGRLRSMLRAHCKAGEVVFPALAAPLPQTHRLAGQTPIEIMAGISERRGATFKNKIVVIGCGSSWHAGYLAEYLIEHIARIPVEVQNASESRYRAPLFRPGDTLIAISSSGRTDDVVECVRNLRSSQDCVLVVSVTNHDSCRLGEHSDAAINVIAGEELGAVSTKVFSSTAMAFVLLAIALGDASGALESKDREDLLDSLERIPGQVQAVLDRESLPLRRQCESGGGLRVGDCALWDISCQNVLAQNFIFLGRGFNFPIALEGSMKVKELAYIHAEGYAAAEMKHGPIALIDKFMPVVCIVPQADPSYDKIKANINEVNARDGFIIAITEEGNDELDDLCEYVIHVPQTHEYLMPLITVIPLQLLAHMMGMLRGNSVDQPRSIRKAYTPSFWPPSRAPSG